jgi:hypothetical protein
MTEWNHDTILSILCWAREEGRADTLDAVFAFLEKPWHYESWREDYLAALALDEHGIARDAGMAVRDRDGDLVVMVDGNRAEFAKPDCVCGKTATATVAWTPTCLAHLEDRIHGYLGTADCGALHNLKVPS